jgi:hypothetical protein
MQDKEKNAKNEEIHNCQDILDAAQLVINGKTLDSADLTEAKRDSIRAILLKTAGVTEQGFSVGQKPPEGWMSQKEILAEIDVPITQSVWKLGNPTQFTSRDNDKKMTTYYDFSKIKSHLHLEERLPQGWISFYNFRSMHHIRMDRKKAKKLILGFAKLRPDLVRKFNVGPQKKALCCAPGLAPFIPEIFEDRTIMSATLPSRSEIIRQIKTINEEDRRR